MKKSFALALALALLQLFLGAAYAQEPSKIQLKASSDSWVEEQNPQAAHGFETDLLAGFDVGKGTRILVAFDLKPVKGAHIQSAQLHLTLKEATGPAVIKMAASGALSSWTESATWERQPERTPTYDTRDVGTLPGVVTWDVTVLLQDTIEAKGALEGIALSGPIVGASEPYTRRFAAREAGEGPRLAIEYIPGAAARSPTPRPAEERASEEREPPGARVIRIGLIVLGTLVGAGAVLVALRRRGVPRAR